MVFLTADIDASQKLCQANLPVDSSLGNEIYLTKRATLKLEVK